MVRFKKSGEFDRLRRELLKQFQKSDGIDSFMARVEDIARQRINADQKLQYMPPEAVHRELMQEIDRYPLVERAVADARMLSDPGFSAGIHRSVTRILRQDRGEPLEEDEAGSPEAMDIDEPSDDETPVNTPNIISHHADAPPPPVQNDVAPLRNSTPALDGVESNPMDSGPAPAVESADIDSASVPDISASKKSSEDTTQVDGSDTSKAGVEAPSDGQTIQTVDDLTSKASPVADAVITDAGEPKSDSNASDNAPIPDHSVPRDADTTHVIQEAPAM